MSHVENVSANTANIGGQITARTYTGDAEAVFFYALPNITDNAGMLLSFATLIRNNETGITLRFISPVDGTETNYTLTGGSWTLTPPPAP